MDNVPILKAMIMLLLVLDPAGNIPVFLSILKDIDAERRKKIILREMLIALAVLLVFLLFGRFLLELLGVKEPSLQLAGGIMLFLISIHMLFPSSGMDAAAVEGRQEPLIVPLAVPLVAGPSAMTILILMGAGAAPMPMTTGEGLLALLGAWGITCAMLMASSRLSRILGPKGLQAMERLMGMILTVISVQMMVSGLKAAFPILMSASK
jgi:multiple antibiotic resistance protein